MSAAIVLLATTGHLLILHVIEGKDGFFWTNLGYEYPLLWGTIVFATFFKGSSEMSVDSYLDLTATKRVAQTNAMRVKQLLSDKNGRTSSQEREALIYMIVPGGTVAALLITLELIGYFTLPRWLGGLIPLVVAMLGGVFYRFTHPTSE